MLLFCQHGETVDSASGMVSGLQKTPTITAWGSFMGCRQWLWEIDVLSEKL